MLKLTSEIWSAELDLFSQLQEDSPYGILIGGADARFIGVNRTFCEMGGYSEREVLGKRFQDLTFTDDIARGERLHAEFLKKRLPLRYVKRYVRKDGVIIPVQVTNYASYESYGELSFTFAFIEKLC